MLFQNNNIVVTPYNTVFAYLQILFILPAKENHYLPRFIFSKIHYKIWDLFNLFKQKFRDILI